MRRVPARVSAIGSVLVLLAGITVWSPAAAASAAGTRVCTATDHRLIGLSGLIVTADGFIAISDSNVDKSAIRIFYLDRRCHYVRSVGYPTAAYDPEDVALGRDGTLYVSDSGDNDRARRTIAVWRLAPGSHTPKIYRYAYPDGPHDAEAVLLTANDTPVFVTKDPFRAGLYMPSGPADPSGKPVPLTRVGTFSLSFTSTPNGLGTLGSVVVDGAAQTADRSKVALRTYADAYEWAVPDGDVVKAITTTKPKVTPLTGEPFGESIAYGPGGTDFYTVSDLEVQPVKTTVLRYPSALSATSGAKTTPAGKPTKPATHGATGDGAATGTAGGRLPGTTLSATAFGAILGAVALAGIVLITIAVVGSARSRRRSG